ncbi:MAG: DUF5337 domain-containing protein [Pseudomonadota bacterium]
MAADHDTRNARKGQTAALVIAGAMVFWLLANVFGPQWGLPIKYAFLIDFAVMAAMIWALVLTYQIWRARQTSNADKG